MVVPTTKVLWSEARKATTAATSAGVPIRPIGTCAANPARTASASVAPATAAIAGVSIVPGETALTRIARSFSSLAQVRV
jgi:hypothetical protein